MKKLCVIFLLLVFIAAPVSAFDFPPEPSEEYWEFEVEDDSLPVTSSWAAEPEILSLLDLQSGDSVIKSYEIYYGYFLEHTPVLHMEDLLSNPESVKRVYYSVLNSGKCVKHGITIRFALPETKEKTVIQYTNAYDELGFWDAYETVMSSLNTEISIFRGLGNDVKVHAHYLLSPFGSNKSWLTIFFKTNKGDFVYFDPSRRDFQDINTAGDTDSEYDKEYLMSFSQWQRIVRKVIKKQNNSHIFYSPSITIALDGNPVEWKPLQHYYYVGAPLLAYRIVDIVLMCVVFVLVVIMTIVIIRFFIKRKRQKQMLVELSRSSETE